MSDTDNSVPSETMKAAILYCLHNFPVTKIIFTKKDGTEREMRCTLMESSLPPRDPDAAAKPHSPDVQPVWDVEAGAWRSFRWDSVTYFSSIQSEVANAE